MRLTLIAAQSLDGFITRHDTPGSAFTSDADKAFFRAALAGFDCCVMGGETYRVSRDAIRAALMPERLRVILTRKIEQFASDNIPERLEFANTPPAQLVASLRQRGFQRCAILGGAQIHSLFLGVGLVDELWLTVEPLLFGAGTALLAAPSSARLELISSEKLAPNTLQLKYRVVK
jgi:dihydrofolate reductase